MVADWVAMVPSVRGAAAAAGREGGQEAAGCQGEQPADCGAQPGIGGHEGIAQWR